MSDKLKLRLLRHTWLFFSSLGFVFGLLRIAEAIYALLQSNLWAFFALLVHISLTYLDYILICYVFWANDQDRRIAELEAKQRGR